MLPSTFVPKTADDFIGPARDVARLLTKLVAASIHEGTTLKVLLLGPPGVGKSALANFAVGLTGATKWTINKLNGTAVKIEKVEEIARDYSFTSLVPGYRVLQIEEIDQVPSAAQVRLLTLLDDLPKGSGCIASSNWTIEQFKEKADGRMQSRFMYLPVAAPTADDIAALLRKMGTPEGAIPMIAEASCGNVRQALLDATAAVCAG